ncbi:MAG: DUF1223 domain-containing protein [Pseudomonadota bacterium]|uniref:DUF1223 domain-containing protein n=1 Tax=Methylophaga aminisulfidivorans TaxID=230105 RepID=UPI0024E1DF2E|nr:DUF1223 domain-containing protein [Methylophaga aminisulfidivorans]MEC9413003.1 DUF1223 domain-containing protein [Pseudomonadota bacterium]
MLKRSCLLFAFSSMLISSLAYAVDWQAKTTDKHLVVIELFTAEGCGLCPAAERWVRQLPQKGLTDKDVVILNFHVDYLDQKKGWVDKFASPVFTDRQKQLARLNLFQTVYTPEFFISGEVLHDWRAHGLEAINFVSEFKPEADISLKAKQHKNSLSVHSRVSVEGDENKQYSQFYLALTENNVISEVRGGDNAGATFNHQHLVRKWLGPFKLDANGKADMTTEVALEKSWKLADMSLVAIVQNMENGYVLQGLALPLKDR